MKGLFIISLSLVSLTWASICTAQKAQTSTKTSEVTVNGHAVKDIFHSAVFIENTGIIPNYKGRAVTYFAAHDNISMAFTEKEVLYTIQSLTEGNHEKEEKAGKHEEDEDNERYTVKSNLVRIEWLGANPHPQIITCGRDSGYFTYVKKIDNKFETITTWGHKTITYKDLYPGIDIEYSFPEKGGLEYTLLVQPGADISKVQIKYHGKVKLKITEGDLHIVTSSGEMVEHAPISFTDDKAIVASAFSLNNKTVGFNFPQGYDKNQALTIDPWVTVLTTMLPYNMGLDIDYDQAGNTFVYGAGPRTIGDMTNLWKIAKFDVNGNVLWTFNGQVISIGWSTVNVSHSYNGTSNEIVDKATGKVYMGKGFDSGAGATMIRVDANGNWDNFVSNASSLYSELWGFAYDCGTGHILALGGGITSNLTMAIVNAVSGALTTSNISGSSSYQEDIICGAYDANGNLYVMMVDNITNALPYPNTIYKINPTFNGNSWSANTGYTTFHESHNNPFYDHSSYSVSAGNSNWFNGLAANGSYLYYYDGHRIVAHSLTNGSVVGTPYTLSNTDTLYQAGIAVDNCDHIYIGAVGAIKTFTFNGSTFTPNTDIPLGAGFSTDTLFDVKYNPSNNLLYVTGGHIAGTYPATLSTTCNTSTNLALAMASTCTSASVVVTPSTPLTNPSFTYFWYDSTGALVTQTTTSSLANVATGLSTGKYQVRVALGLNCSSNIVVDSVIVGGSVALTAHDTTICNGQSVTLAPTPATTGGTYSWSPGGATTPTILVSPTVNTTYTVTYTLGGCTATKNIAVTVGNNNVTLNPTDTTICSGATAVVKANPSVPGGTYAWSPGGSTIDSLIVSPAITTTYNVTYTTTGCGSATGVATVHINQPPTVAVNNATICAGSNAVLTATGNPAGGTYSWSPGGATTASITVNPANATTYTATYTLGCAATNTGVVTVNPKPNAGPDQNISTTTTATMGAVGNGSWTSLSTNPATVSISGINNPTSTVTAFTVAGTYGFVWTVNGCTDTVIFNVTQPIITSSLAVICLNTATTINAAGTGTWAAAPTNPAVATIVNPNSPNTNVTGFSTIGNYVFIWTGSLGNDTAVVSVRALPTVVINAVNQTCISPNSSLTAVASSGTLPYTYLWNNSSTSTTINNPIANTTYVVTVTDSVGCTATASTTTPAFTAVQISAHEIPLRCNGDNTGVAFVNPSGGLQPYQYLWSTGQTTISINSLTTGTYKVTVTDAHGCTAVDSAIVTEPPTVNIAAIADSVSCYLAHDAVITASATGGTTPYTFAMNSGAPQSAGAFNGLIAGNYSIEVKDANNCAATTTVTLLEPTPMQVAATGINPRCHDENSGNISFNAAGGKPPYIIALNNKNVTDSAMVANLSAGIYNLLVTDSKGCADSTSITLTAPPAIAVEVSPAIDTVIFGKSITLISIAHAWDTMPSTYAWEPAEGLSCADCPQPVATPLSTTTYMLTYRDSSGCVATVQSTIFVDETNRPLYIPNIFSPNGDGQNDLFFVYGSGIKTIDLTVYDRWGSIVYATKDPTQGWDGTFQGKPLVPAVFVYQAKIIYLDNTQKTAKGSVTLMR